jgi:hypothetical protein
MKLGSLQPPESGGDRLFRKDQSAPRVLPGFEPGQLDLWNLDIKREAARGCGDSWRYDVEGCLHILVHNASTPSYGPTKTITFTNAKNQSVTAIVGTSASITLDSTNVGGNRSDLTEPSWWSDLKGVAGSPIQLGHILGSQIGGKEKGAANLTPLYAAANTPAMRTCEGFLRALIDSCKYCSVEVTITVNNYGGNTHAPAKAKPVMPTSVTITWMVDSKIKGTFTIDNDPDAETQDPCRVANLPCR